jgi:biopolymer transport protein ExbB/TolQ
MASVISELVENPAGNNQHPLAGKWNVQSKDAHKHLLVYRFALFNIVATAFLGVAYVHGFVHMVLAADRTMISVAIFAVFLAGLAISGALTFGVSRELNKVRRFDANTPSQATEYLNKLGDCAGEDRSVIAGATRLRLSHRIAVVRHIANSLVLLGLIGTVVGFIIALSGVDPQKAADFASVSPMVSTLIRGMSTALYTTLVGGILNLWLTVNYQLLATGTVKLITALHELGAQRETSK